MSTYLIDNWHIVFDWCWLMLIFQIDADWCWLILFYSDWWLLWHCEINEISKSVFACWNSSGTWLRLVLLAEERRRWGTFTEASLFSCFVRLRVATRSRGWVVSKRDRCCIACQQCWKYFQWKVSWNYPESIFYCWNSQKRVTVKDEMSFYCILST